MYSFWTQTYIHLIIYISMHACFISLFIHLNDITDTNNHLVFVYALWDNRTIIHLTRHCLLSSDFYRGVNKNRTDVFKGLEICWIMTEYVYLFYAPFADLIELLNIIGVFHSNYLYSAFLFFCLECCLNWKSLWVFFYLVK